MSWDHTGKQENDDSLWMTSAMEMHYYGNDRKYYLDIEWIYSHADYYGDSMEASKETSSERAYCQPVVMEYEVRKP